jgi:V/A-type H+-transporting ATPase subunit E
MADELQSLLEKINSEGVKKAEAERENIVNAAKAEAERIVDAAKAEAENIVSAAKAESEALHDRAESALEQAARDTILRLKMELVERLCEAIDGAAAQALDPALMAEIVKMLAARFVTDPDSEVTVRCAVKDRDALDAALKNALAASLRKAPKVLADSAMTGGLELGTDNGRIYFDFSLEAVSEVVGDYAGENVAALFRDK